MHRFLTPLREKKDRHPLAMLAGWIWLCVIAMSGGLGLTLALSGFGPFEILPHLAFDLPSDPQADLRTNPLPTLTPHQHTRPLADGLQAVPPASTPFPSQTPITRARFAYGAYPGYIPRSLAGPDYWEGPLVIGASLEGRLLEVYRFRTGSISRMIVAGIHGGYEWNTVALADELIAHLQKHPKNIPPDMTLYILRVMNPDGLARGEGYEGRLNTHGVDLNRNFPSNWQAEWPNSGCWNHLVVSSGEFPASEPETQALIGFVREHSISALISYHSAFLGIFPGGIPLHVPSVHLAQAVAEVTSYRYPPVETGCAYTGTLADWASDQGAAALDLELHTHETTDFEENLTVLQVFLSWQPQALTGR